MILGAIEISSRSVRFCVADVGSNASTRVTERFHTIKALPENLERLTAILMAEAAADPELAAALRDRVTAHRRADLRSRLERGPQALAVEPDDAVDLINGPVFVRALMEGRAVDDRLIDAVVGAVVVGGGGGRP